MITTCLRFMQKLEIVKYKCYLNAIYHMCGLLLYEHGRVVRFEQEF